MQPEELRAAIEAVAPGVRVDVEPDPERALSQTLAAAGAHDLVCATGSFYLAGPARRILGGAARGG